LKKKNGCVLLNSKSKIAYFSGSSLLAAPNHFSTILAGAENFRNFESRTKAFDFSQKRADQTEIHHHK
jgi:hypothetical protein